MKIETDDFVLQRRQKQINYAKNCLGYGTYLKNIARSQRTLPMHPQTPNKFQKCSSRSWDGQMKKWKALIHQWDPVNAAKIGMKSEDEIKQTENESIGTDCSLDQTSTDTLEGSFIQESNISFSCTFDGLIEAL